MKIVLGNNHDQICHINIVNIVFQIMVTEYTHFTKSYPEKLIQVNTNYVLIHKIYQVSNLEYFKICYTLFPKLTYTPKILHIINMKPSTLLWNNFFLNPFDLTIFTLRILLYKSGWLAHVKVLHSWKHNTNLSGETMEFILADENVSVFTNNLYISENNLYQLIYFMLYSFLLT